MKSSKHYINKNAKKSPYCCGYDEILEDIINKEAYNPRVVKRFIQNMNSNFKNAGSISVVNIVYKYYTNFINGRYTGILRHYLLGALKRQLNHTKLKLTE